MVTDWGKQFTNILAESLLEVLYLKRELITKLKAFSTYKSLQRLWWQNNNQFTAGLLLQLFDEARSLPCSSGQFYPKQYNQQERNWSFKMHSPISTKLGL